MIWPCQVEQISQLATFSENLLDYHRQCTEILEVLAGTLHDKWGDHGGTLLLCGGGGHFGCVVLCHGAAWLFLSRCSVWYRVLYKYIYKTIKPVLYNVGSATVISTNHYLNCCCVRLWELSSSIIRFLLLALILLISFTKYVIVDFSLCTVWHQLHLAGKMRPPAVPGMTLSPRRCRSSGWPIHSMEVCHLPMLLVSLSVYTYTHAHIKRKTFMLTHLD